MDGAQIQAAMRVSGLYLRSRTSRQAAFGGQSNGLIFVLFVSFVAKKLSFASVFFVPPVKPFPPSPPFPPDAGK